MSGMSSSPLSSSQSQVFAGEKGKSWRFFVEATAVRERPSLIRKILKNGGIVVHSAREADILLAENNTKEALELFEGWRGDRILLSTRWVARCLQEHAFLGNDRGWGGCELTREALLQGIAVSDDASEAEDEEVSQNPNRSRLTVPSPQHSKPSPSISLPEPGPSRLRPSNATSSSRSRKLSSKAEQVLEQKPHNLIPHTHNPTSQLHAQGSFHPPQNPMDTSLQASLSCTQTTIQQQQQALLATMFGNLIQPSQQPFNPDILTSLGQYSNFAQIPPLLSPPFQQLLSQQIAVNPLALPPHRTEPAEQPGLGDSRPQLTGSGILLGSTQQSSTRPTPEDLDTDLVSDTASVRSEEGEVELSISRKRGGIARLINDSSSDHDVKTAVSSTPPCPKENAPKKLTGIFVDRQRMPHRFYLMVDIKNRKNLLKIIRKHKGTIVSQMKDADFIILNNRSNQFQKALSLLPRNKIAISPSWLEECENLGKMTEIGPHVIDIASGIGQGALRRKTTVKAQRSIPEDCESEEGAPARIGQPETPSKTGNPQEGKATTLRSRSPSPLPPTNITPTSFGNLFTEEDRIWFFKYARFKLERDPRLTQVALMDAVAHKAPHHTARSWTNSARTKWPDEFDMLRREVVTLRGHAHKALPSPSSPLNELIYPATPPTSMPSLSLPTSNASPSHNSQAEPIFTTPFKRKEHSNQDEVGVVAMDQQNKKLKTTDEVIDVDAYLQGWVTPI